MTEVEVPSLLDSFLDSFFGKYSSYIFLLAIVLGYLLLRKILMNKRLDNRKNVYEDCETIARLSCDRLKKQSPEVIAQYSNVKNIQELIAYNTLEFAKVDHNLWRSVK